MCLRRALYPRLGFRAREVSATNSEARADFMTNSVLAKFITKTTAQSVRAYVHSIYSGGKCKRSSFFFVRVVVYSTVVFMVDSSQHHL